MKGSLSVHFSELFRDTLICHGFAWCVHHYCIKGKMSHQEFAFWMKSVHLR